MRRYFPRVLLVLSVVAFVVGACVIRTTPRTHRRTVIVEEPDKKKGKHKKHVKHVKHKKHKKHRKHD